MAANAVTRLGFHLSNFTFPGAGEGDLFDRTLELANAAEQSGFDSLWLLDHFYQLEVVGLEDEPMLEPYTLLGAIGARTASIKLGTLVTGVTYRNPAFLAKTLTTLDVLSKGRAILGIGAAWHEREHLAYGYDFPSTGERFDRLEETLEICRAMFSASPASFSGDHYAIREALNVPRPIQPNGPPILIGGNGPNRTLRCVARYADACSLLGDMNAIKAALETLKRHCEAEGRDYETITKTALIGIIMEPTTEQAKTKLQEVMAGRSILRTPPISGNADEVATRLNDYLEAGLDGLIITLRGDPDPESVTLAGKTLSRLFA